MPNRGGIQPRPASAEYTGVGQVDETNARPEGQPVRATMRRSPPIETRSTEVRVPELITNSARPVALAERVRMRHMRRSLRGLGLLVILFATGFAVQTAAQSVGEFKALMRIEAGGQPPLDMEYYVGQEQVRIDMPQGMSMISTSGDNPSMLMVQHQQKRYIEWGPDQLRMMQQMLQQMPGSSDSPQGDDVDLTFEETGLREQIGDWDAFEVRFEANMDGADHEEGSLWLTTDADIGLFELSVRIASAASALQMPMAGGGGGVADQLSQYQAMAAAEGLPEGRVVRIDSQQDKQTATVTLLSVEPGALPVDTFEAPAGYEPMQMPSIPGGLPGGLPGE